MAKERKTTTPVKKIVPKQRVQEIYKKLKLKFLTPRQKDYWDLMDENQIIICSGPSGSGKSYLSVKKALDLLHDENNNYEKIIVVRPAVEVGRTLGLLPGDLKEKMGPYVYPTFYLVDKIIGKDNKDTLLDENIIEVIPLSYMRGTNIDNSILILEECQNTTPEEIKMLLTRIGFNSKFLISGDLEQSDLFKDKSFSGLFDAKYRLQDIPELGFFEFTDEDIVRNPIIKKILNRY